MLSNLSMLTKLKLTGNKKFRTSTVDRMETIVHKSHTLPVPR